MKSPMTKRDVVPKSFDNKRKNICGWTYKTSK